MSPIRSQEKPSGASNGAASPLSEGERLRWQDHEWVLHDPEVQRRYAGSVVAVSNRVVLASAESHQQALQAALAGPSSPPRSEIVTVAVEGRPLAEPMPSSEPGLS